MTSCWKKWMKMTLKLDRMTFLNCFQHLLLDVAFQDSIPLLYRFDKEKCKWRSKGAGKYKRVTIFCTTVKLTVWREKNSLCEAGNEIRNDVLFLKPLFLSQSLLKFLKKTGNTVEKSYLA